MDIRDKLNSFLKGNDVVDIKLLDLTQELSLEELVDLSSGLQSATAYSLSVYMNVPDYRITIYKPPTVQNMSNYFWELQEMAGSGTLIPGLWISFPEIDDTFAKLHTRIVENFYSDIPLLGSLDTINIIDKDNAILENVYYIYPDEEAEKECKAELGKVNDINLFEEERSLYYMTPYDAYEVLRLTYSEGVKVDYRDVTEERLYS